MDDNYAAQLQIYSMEENSVTTAVCIVRCVGGIARTGQQFVSLPGVDGGGNHSRLTLDWIHRYERPVDFLEPPHSAKVHFSSREFIDLKKGVVITAVETED
ncbi:hypothetical protein [Streptomyces sp. AF1A]|uniref:hypothetical protein n=1 Tax=Streptomyces sp. AF1A TaxID=3394350 RepID=UPI0039BD76B1